MKKYSGTIIIKKHICRLNRYQLFYMNIQVYKMTNISAKVLIFIKITGSFELQKKKKSWTKRNNLYHNFWDEKK